MRPNVDLTKIKERLRKLIERGQQERATTLGIRNRERARKLQKRNAQLKKLDFFKCATAKMKLYLSNV